MRKQLILTVLVFVLCEPAHAQSREVTESGVFFSDAAGRYVRLEGRDGIVVSYLYDTPRSTETSGLAVRLNDTMTLTVRYDGSGGVAVTGLPALMSVVDHEGRTTAVQADRKTVALLDYASSGLVSAVTLPSRLTWKVSEPDASHRVRQSVEDAFGKVVASAIITKTATRRGTWYGAVAADLGLSPGALTYEPSPTGALTTARDSKGQVAFYIVHTDACDVGFATDGTPRFYDLTLSVFGGSVPPGGDLLVSPAWEAQRAAVPDHFVLTASGVAGLYVAEAAKKAIVAAWADRDGRLSAVTAEGEPVARGSSR
jgi:hypothetical protein